MARTCVEMGAAAIIAFLAATCLVASAGAAEAPYTCSHAAFEPRLNTVNITMVNAACNRVANGPGVKTVLVTGSAGFVGHAVAKYLARNNNVLGLDSFNDYYPPSLKVARAKDLHANWDVPTVRADLNDGAVLRMLFETCKFTHIIHLAAQAGVRYAAKNPMSYVDSNIAGQVTIFEEARRMEEMPAIVYASSSSVYGANKIQPFSELHRVDLPSSLYAATKRTDEYFARVYHSIYGLSMIGLRFFTVYGPWGRPDMAAYQFAKNIMKGEPIRIFQGPGETELSRDFTFIDDIVQGVVACVDRIPPSKKGRATNTIFNLGNTDPHTVSELVDALEVSLGKTAIRKYTPLPALGDVLSTYSNITRANKYLSYNPQTSLTEGVKRFVEWYFKYYGETGNDWRPDELYYTPM